MDARKAHAYLAEAQGRPERPAWLDHDHLCQRYRSQGAMPCDCQLSPARQARAQARESSPRRDQIRFGWPGGGAFNIDRCCDTPDPMMENGGPDGALRAVVCRECRTTLASLTWRSG